MPVVEYAVGKGAERIAPGHALVLAAGVAAAVALVVIATKASPGGGAKVPASTTESLPVYTFEPPPEQPVLGPQQHIGGYVFTPHRFPRVCGGELSAVIKYGHATLRIPHSRDMTWLTQPPGEVSL